MKWSNVKLIFRREVADQLRDRRMLFMVAVLPLLLYPLLGMTFMQITQFIQEHPTRIWVVGAAQLPPEPVLFEEIATSDGTAWRFASEYFPGGSGVDLLQLELASARVSPSAIDRAAREKLDAGECDAVLYFPPDFGRQVSEYRLEVARRARNARQGSPSQNSPAEEATANGPAAGGESSGEQTASAETESPREESAQNKQGGRLRVPEPEIIFSAAKDKSRMAQERLGVVLGHWRKKIDAETRVEVSLPPADLVPFEVATRDVAPPKSSGVSLWSKVLPFVLLVWALTGAFYPAIDLCAGEKERGTLETLLSSPALRSEIVWGKLLTVMLFSAATAILNLFSMGLTGAFILHQLQGMSPIALGPPPLLTIGWLLVAVIPISALFSALSLALAAMARSTKEGQYYLMPLLLVTMPLMLIPLLPAAEIDLGKSLIPVSGLMLLLRTLMEGQYMEALRYALPVIVVTGICCHFAIRWAVDQFNKESVIFRESERFSLGQWMFHLIRDRADTPSAPEAAMCGMLLLVMGFFARLTIRPAATWDSVAIATIVLQIAFVLAPVLIMAIVLTRKPSKTLLLRAPRPLTIPAAAALAICIHPVVISLGVLLETLYPIKDKAALEGLSEMFTSAPLWQVLLVLAVLPAICEELAFRGFILSGLRHIGHKWGAIALSSLFFGLAHMILIQQSISAFMLGLVLGFIAVQTRSILPGMLFHVLHNSIMLVSTRPDVVSRYDYPWFRWMFQDNADIPYSWPLVAIAGVLTIGILFWFRSEPYLPTEEERLQEALDHQKVPAA